MKKTRQDRSALAQHLLRFRDCAEHMIERRRRNGGDQRFAVAVELVVPAAPHGMAEIMPFEPRQRRARLVRRARLARLRPARSTPLRSRSAATAGACCAGCCRRRRPRRPGSRWPRRDSAARSPAARRATLSGRAARDAFKALQQPDPFRLMAGLDADRLDLRPVLLEIFAERPLLLVVEIGEEQREELAGAFWNDRSWVASKPRSSPRTDASAGSAGAAATPASLP